METINLPRPLTRDAAMELREALLHQVLDGIKQVTEVEEGYVLDFGRLEDELAVILAFIEVERHCNPFLRLRLSLGSNDGPIKLRLTGPAGTKEFLVRELGLKRWLNQP
jgi:hypothetical protein